MKSVLINLLSFKAGWAASVAGAAASVPALGAAIATGVIVSHLWRTRDVRAEGLLLISAALIGFAWESALVAAGLIRYETGFLFPGMAPYWIVAMWVLFATTLNVGMRWLRNSVWIAAAAGAAGGPLAFIAGQKMGAVSFDEPVTSLIVIGIGWAVLLPMLVQLAVRFDGHTEESDRVPAFAAEAQS
jgi:hypothetical protein